MEGDEGRITFPEIVVLSEAKDLHVRVLRFAQDDNCHGLGVAGAPGVPKSTFGASRDSGLVAVKYFRSFAPVIFAVSTAGKRRM